MSLVVQKYGGTSVADPERDQARRRRGSPRPPRPGNASCVVVSAMGDTTDELIALAAQVSPNPHPRELDMLLTAGERISMALLCDGDQRPRPRGDLVHRLAGGIVTDTTPRQGAHHRDAPGRVHEALDAGKS